MNKLLLIPLTIMFLLTLYSFSTTGVFDGANTNIEGNHSINVGGNTTNVEIPNAGNKALSISNPTMVLAILGIALTVGIVAGVRVLGSGLSDESQRIIFISVLFLALWGILSVFSGNTLFSNALFSYLWIILTIIFVIGLGLEISGGSTGGGD